MTVTWIAGVVCLAGLLARGRWAIVAQLVFCVFGAASAMSLSNGANITPAMLFVPFLVLQSLLVPRQPTLRISKAGLLLVALAVWGLFSAFYLPRLFAGSTDVFILDRDSIKQNVALYPLKPTGSNLTQSVLLVADTLAFFAFRRLLGNARNMHTFGNALLLIGGLNCLGALINLAEYYAGLPSLLGYVRNAAGYSLAIQYEMAGLMRLHGTFPEASLFAYFTLMTLPCAWSLWSDGVRPWLSGTVALGSLLLLLLSTSGTGYVGLSLYLLVRLVFRLSRVPPERLRKVLLPMTVALLLVMGLLLAQFAFETYLAQRISDVFQTAVLGKLESESGIERSSWDKQAWVSFLETYGVGVGLGSGRASSYPLVVLSNVGVLGAVLLVLFLSQLFRGMRSLDPDVHPVRRAAQHGALAALLGSSVGMFDLGVGFYALAAAASTALPHARWAGGWAGQPAPQPAPPLPPAAQPSYLSAESRTAS